MTDYLNFEKEMNDLDIKQNRRWLWILIIVLIFTASVLIMNIGIIYHEPRRLFNAFSSGLLTFTFLFNLQQYAFVWQDYSLAKRKKEIYDKFDLERRGQESIRRRINEDAMQSCPQNKTSGSNNS